MGRSFEANPKRSYHTLEISKFLIQEVIKNLKRPNTHLVEIWAWVASLAITIAEQTNKIAWIIATEISKETIEDANTNIEAYKLSKKIQVVNTNYVDDIEINTKPDLIYASLPYGNESYLTPWNTMDQLMIHPEISYFHPSGNPMWCYNEMIQSIIKKWRNTTVIIETWIMPKDIVASCLNNYQNVKWKYKIHDSSWFSTTRFSFNSTPL